MDDKMDKKLEKMFGAAMQKTELQVPPNDFTDKIMNRIEQVEIEPSLSYSSLLPKKVLWSFAALILGTSSYFLITGNYGSGGWFNSLNIGFELPEISFPSIELAFSNTVVYAFVLLGIMFLIQTSLLKGYFNRRLA